MAIARLTPPATPTIARARVRLFSVTMVALLFGCDQGQQRPLLCTQLLVDDPSEDTGAAMALGPADVTRRRSAMQAAAPPTRWPHNVSLPLTLRVKFLNGSPFQRQKVQQYASEWTNVSAPLHEGAETRLKVHFTFVPDATKNRDTDVRIMFEKDGGSSSYVGIVARRIHHDSATMFFGWVEPGEPEASIRQVILHEFGHALGLVHEHQSPDARARIPWDTQAVYRYYGRTQGWDRDDVDVNIFETYDATITNYTAYDPLSIMHYAIPSSLTKGRFSTPWNSALSATDSAFFKELYPYWRCSPREKQGCCFNQRGRRVACP